MGFGLPSGIRLGLSPFKSRTTAAVETPGFAWTTFTEHATTQKVYVSSTGSDANDGLSSATPKQTLAAGIALLRDGYPDWLLLKRGDTFVHQTFGTWTKSGLDATNKMVIGAYGTGARPIVDVNGDAFYGGSGPSYLAFTSIEVTILSRAPGEEFGGFSAFGGHDVLFEDMSIHNLATGIGMQDFGGSGRPTNYRFRRCQIYDICGTVTGAIGVFLSQCDGFEFNECLIDYCGWINGVVVATDFNHNTYFQNDCGPIIFKNCTSARSSLEGVKARCGGEITGNLFLANKDIAELRNGGNDAVYAVTPATFNDNVAIESRLQNLADVFGSCAGVRVETCHGWDISRNIVAGNTLLPTAIAGPLNSWTFSDASSVYGTQGISDITFADNIVYKWHGQLQFENNTGNALYCHHITFTDNVFHEPWNDNNGYGNPNYIAAVGNALDATVTASGNTYYSTRTSAQWFALFGTAGGTYGDTALWKAQWSDTTSVSADISAGWPNPNADVGDYLASIGETNANDPWTDIDTLMGLMRGNHKESWNDAHSGPAVRDWFRANFGLAPV